MVWFDVTLQRSHYDSPGQFASWTNNAPLASFKARGKSVLGKGGEVAKREKQNELCPTGFINPLLTQDFSVRQPWPPYLLLVKD